MSFKISLLLSNSYVIQQHQKMAHQ